MAESTLSYGYPVLMREVGHLLGYSYDISEYSADETTQVDFIVQSGYRQFLYPPPLPGESIAHVWSFLRPVTHLDTAADTWQYDLPDDFGGLAGRLTYNDQTLGMGPIEIRGEGEIRRLRARGTVTGKPTRLAVRPKTSDGTTGQRFELVLWPTPSGIWQLDYAYNVLVNKLTAGAPYPLGGMAHSETILESCLAVAERREDDEATIHWQGFMERLAASVSHDQQVMVPETLGYNADSSDAESIRVIRSEYVEYGGTVYE